MATVSPGQALLRAQQAALQADQRLDRLALDPVVKRAPDLPIADSIVSAKAILTIEGASTVEIEIEDQDWQLEASGLLDRRDDGRLDAIDITLDTIVYRLSGAQRDQGGTTVKLTFEDRIVALLRQKWGAKSASRGSMTRAQFIESLVREVHTVKIPFWAPEKGRTQPVEKPDYPSTAPARNETGFDPGTKLKIKGALADAEQMRQMATALGVAAQENAGPLATLALVVSGIGESEFRDVPNAAGSPYGGVLQALKTRHMSTAEQAHAFLHGGQGFQAGGAIKLARENPGITAGDIATRVEASGEAPSFYDAHRPEARKIIAAYNKGEQSGGGEDETVLTTTAYQFHRGSSDDPKEDSFECGLRLGEEVNWRFYAAGGVAVFQTDDLAMLNKATLVLDGPNDPGLLERPGYEWHQGKLAGEVELHVNANRYAIPPSAVIALQGDGWGPVGGRWITHTAEYNLLQADDTTLTLIKPLPPRKEPAPEIKETSTGTDPESQAAGVKRTLAWARSKIGHYKETFANNRGAELDKLEKQFGFTGAPWCAIFATSAVAQGAGDNVKTAAVAQIRAWAAEGSHGYQRGFRATPKPGDLMCFGTAHVALVEKVNGDSVTTIEGNTSAGKVVRSSRLASSGDFVRPDYPT